MTSKNQKLTPSKILAFYTILALGSLFIYSKSTSQSIILEDNFRQVLVHGLLGVLIALPIILLNYFLIRKTSIFHEFIQFIKTNIAPMDHFEIIAVAIFSGL